jgi:hypothetical protein
MLEGRDAADVEIGNTLGSKILRQFKQRTEEVNAPPPV